VPEQSSSPRTRLCGLALSKISRSSDTSTANEDKPAHKLSWFRILVRIDLKGASSKVVAGTYDPACASKTLIPMDFMSEDFPDAFIPYKSHPFVWLEPRETSCFTYSTRF
jgi:hypothetical protein